MSRHRRRKKKIDSGHFRIDENLRNGLPVARRSLHRERRQFDSFDDDFLPPSKISLSDDITSRDYSTYSRVDGQPADVVQSMPFNKNPRSLPNPDVFTALHDYFFDPSDKVSLCVRRSRRRRVIFALRLNKKGSGSGKRHRWTDDSLVRCV